MARRAPGAVLETLMHVITEAGDGETVTPQDFIGAVADGTPLTRNDVQRGLRYLERVCHVLRRTGTSEWEIVSVDAFENGQRDFANWNEEERASAEWVSRFREINKDRIRRCSTCGITLGLLQEECDLCT